MNRRKTTSFTFSRPYAFRLFLVELPSFYNNGRVSDVTKHPNWRLLNNEKCGVSTAYRIIGGNHARLGMYPWIARIEHYGKGTNRRPAFICAGTLINKMYVVTAAHCVKPYVTKIRLGENNAATAIDCENNVCAEKVQDFKPSAIIVHERYDYPKNRNDIALIRLDRPAILNRWVQPICLPSRQQLVTNYVGRKVEVAGWGIYDNKIGKSSNQLLYVKLPIVDDRICIEGFRGEVQVGNGQMCAGGVIGEDSCNGDSGGPLMLAESISGVSHYYLLGIVSFGPKKCGGSKLPGVYTRVATYVDWIVNKLAP